MNKVLIIDDDVFLTALYAKLLRGEGLEVDVANSGDAALALIADSRPDLIVLDLHMPGMHGTDVLRAMRADERLQHIRVIIFATGYIKSLMSEVCDLGVHKVFSKMKCKPRALVAEIKESLASIKHEAVQVPEKKSALEAGAEHLGNTGKEHLSTWIERLRTDGRAEARRVCLLHLYRITRKDMLAAISMAATTSEGKLGRALKKLLEDLYDHPQRIQDSTVESLEQALQKLMSFNEKARAAKLDSETTLQDVLKGF